MTLRLCLVFAFASCCGISSLTKKSLAEPPSARIRVAWQGESESDPRSSVTPAASSSIPAWVPAMRAVHAQFKGKPGTFAQFGDSISVSMAFWTPTPTCCVNVSMKSDCS